MPAKRGRERGYSYPPEGAELDDRCAALRDLDNVKHRSDLISSQNDEENCTVIAGKAEGA
jgi:hypothetical protein